MTHELIQRIQKLHEESQMGGSLGALFEDIQVALSEQDAEINALRRTITDTMRALESA